MLISYRDSKRYPSDPLALQTWVHLAELAARQVVCGPGGFDPGQFARTLELCRQLTRKQGPDGLRRMIVTCAAAGVAVVVVPTFERCHVSSASKWLSPDRTRAMIALSIRYKRDDQLYFSLFREAGAILLVEKTEERNQKSEVPDASASRCDQFAREFLIPPEYAPKLAAIALVEGVEEMSAAIVKLAAGLGIAPGLVVGRLQHDLLIGWKHQNALKREVDLSYVLKASAAAQETWPDQKAATEQVMRDFGLEDNAARLRIMRAVKRGKLRTNGQTRKLMRLDPAELTRWRLGMRDRDLDAEDRDEAA